MIMKTTTRKSLLNKSDVEYADYGINHVEGCAHGCTFPCYARLIRKKTYDAWLNPYLVSNALELLDKELPEKARDIKNVHLCFMTDLFMVGYPEVTEMTLAILEKLHTWGLQVETLTKGITPAVLLDTDKYGSKTWYGATVVSLDGGFARQYDPYSAPVSDRISSLKVLHDAGLQTWVSIEPFPTLNIVNQRIEDLLEAVSFVDCIVFGRWNYNNIAKHDGHTQFYVDRAHDVIDFCRERGIASYIKKEVRSCLIRENIPQELKDKRQWVNWDFERRDGKQTKVPKQPNGRNADSTDPATWSDLETCLRALENGSRFKGVGFVFNGDYTGTDFDNCVADREITNPDVARLVAQLKSYTEYSQSGRGLHVLNKAVKPGLTCRKTGTKVEMYDSGRFFCMTGDLFDGCGSSIESHQDDVDLVYRELFGDETSSGKIPSPSKISENRVRVSRIDDDVVIERASAAKNGDKFKRLFFNGDIAEYADDDSAADLALCDLLTFWCGDDREQIDRLFRQSQLMRPKWDRPTGATTYGEMTIATAIDGCGEVYQGSNESEKVTDTNNLDGACIDVTQFFDGKSFVPERLAEWILSKRHFLTFDDNDEIYVYNTNDGLYHPNGVKVIRALSQNALQDRTRNRHVSEVEGYIERNRYFNRLDLENEPALIPVDNCILDTRSESIEIIAYTPNVPYVSKIAATHVPGQDCPEWKKFLKSTCNKEDIPVIQEIFGDALFRSYWLKYAVMLLGPGDNGKSVLINVLNALLGTDNVSHRSLQEIEFDRFAVADLFGKFANTYADIDSTALKHTGKFKMATGRDRMKGEKKFQGTFYFYNYAILIFSCNDLPPTYDTADAFYDRWILIEFPYKFVDNPRAENEKKRDPHLLEKLTTPEELSGILNWALEGLMRLRKNNGFTKSGSGENVKQRWIAATDSLASFVDAMVTYDEGALVETDTLYNAFLEYCKENEATPIEKGQVTKRLPRLMKGKTKKYRPWGDGKDRPYAWKDISVSGVTRTVHAVQDNFHATRTREDNKEAVNSDIIIENKLDCSDCEQHEYEHEDDESPITNICDHESAVVDVRNYLNIRANSGLTTQTYDELVLTSIRDLLLQDRALTTNGIRAAFDELLNTDRELIVRCIDFRAVVDT